MTCSATPPLRTVTTKKILVFSLGGTAPATSNIFVMTEDDIIQLAPLLKQFQVTVIVENATTNAQTKAVFEPTEDGCTWDTAFGIESGFTTGNRKTSSPWYSTASDFKRGLRIGVRCQQSTGTAIEMAYVQLIIDFELKS